MMDVDVDAGSAGRPPPPPASPAFQAALDAAASDYRTCLAGLRAALTDLAAAETDETGGRGGGKQEAAARAAAATQLEAEVAALRARVDAGNAGALDVATRLSALVEDLDAWRVQGMGRWTGGQA